MRTPKRYFSLLGALIVTVTATTTHFSGGAQAEEAKQSPAVERTRKTVRMLDDVYKTAVVLITEHYVNDEDDLPAGAAAIALFDAINKKGWHQVRLLDVTGQPYDDENVAKDAFEKQAVKKMKAGEAWFDKVEKGKEGKRTLRVATPIPVVMKKCVMCHPHYEDAKEGEAIGMLSYSMPIE